MPRKPRFRFAAAKAVALVPLALAAAAVAPVDAGAQEVRVVADGTPVRLDPNDSSPVITTVAAGTTLEWVGESGDWYAVTVAGQPGQDEVIGYVLASQVEVVAGAAPPGAPPVPGAPTGALPATLGIPDVEVRYEAERRRRSSGVGKLIWGLVIIGTGYAALEFIPPLQEPVAEDYDTAEEYQDALDLRSSAETGRTVATGLGAALGAWGLTDIGLGWSNMRNLELELPRTSAPSLQVQYGDAFRMRSSGRRKVFWAIFLPVVTYGVVEWVPYFGVPDAADFDNVEDYNAAVKRRDRAESAKTWTTRLGVGLGGWGVTQWVLGARRMSQIEATARMTAMSPFAPTLADIPVELFASRRDARTQLGIQVRW